MASNGDLYFTSPNMPLPPSQPTSYFTTNHNDSQMNNSLMANGLDSSLLTDNALLPTPGSVAGRKRSRGDVLAPEEDERGLGDGSTNTPSTGVQAKPRGEPILGQGMSLVYPDEPAYEARPESQSGTWVEERDERNQWHLLNEGRPPISTRKSQRVDASASAPDDLAQLLLPAGMREVTAEPLIDEATRSLGISWMRMDSTEALRISQAAYSKWIQNHYAGLQDVSVWFENSALPGYLVAAQNSYNHRTEYYIFSHDLLEARLVTNDPTQLVARLQMLPALHLAAPGGLITADNDMAGHAASVSAPVVSQEPEPQSIHQASIDQLNPAILQNQVEPADVEMN